MDLGIQGKRALVTASSRGLGRGVAEALAAEGVSLVINARDVGALDGAKKYICERFSVDCIAISGDITTQEGRARVLDAAGEVDILVTNAGGPPPGIWSDWSRSDFIAALDANMLTPIALMQAVLPGMISRRWGRIVNITSSSVRAPIPELGLSNTARTGLTGFTAGTARQVAAHGVAINNLLPGIHDTDRAHSLDEGVANTRGMTHAQARAAREATIPARRYGTSVDFGAMAAFLCSEQAGFIIGQNILLDGGAVNLTL